MTSHPIAVNCADYILVASPSHVVRQRVLESLRSPRRHFEQAAGGAEALLHLETGGWQMLFLDRHLPDLDVEELSQTVRQHFPGVEVILLDPALDANSAGVPLAAVCRSDELVDLSPRGTQEKHRRDEEDTVLPRTLMEPLPGMIGNSRAMQPVYRLARLLAPRDTTVLVTEPTGSGKEIVARAIHQLSPRAGHTFAVVNCAAIPETLLEAELFGYARGAFTGAAQSYSGRIQTAQEGTLFLDEIGEMPLSPAAQAAPISGAERVAAFGQHGSPAGGCPRGFRYECAFAHVGTGRKVPRRLVLPALRFPD